MPEADCNACLRKHERPVNTKCLYAKEAVAKCKELRIPISDYMDYLPDLGVLEDDPALSGQAMAGHANPALSPTDKYNSELVRELIKENMDFKRLLLESKDNMDRVCAHMQTLTLQLSDRERGRDITVGGNDSVPISRGAKTHDTQVGAVGGGGRPEAIPPTSHPSYLLSAGDSQRTSFTTVTQPQMPVGFTQPPLYHPWVFDPTLYGLSSERGRTQDYRAAAASVDNDGTTSRDPDRGARSAPSAASSSSMPNAGMTAPSGNLFAPDPRLPWPPACAVQYPGLWPSTKSKRKCVVYDLEPHLTCDNVKQCTIDDVLSASFFMLECMMIKGFGVREYTKHVKFLVDKSKVYTSQALVRYDQAVREKAELLGPSAFMYGDHELYHLFLGLEQLKPKAKVDVDRKGKTTGYKVKKGLGTCWRFNDGRPCQKQPCPFKHECSECGGSHRQSDCTNAVSK